MAELLKGKALFPGNDCILNIKHQMRLEKYSLVLPIFSNALSVSMEMFLR